MGRFVQKVMWSLPFRALESVADRVARQKKAYQEFSKEKGNHLEKVKKREAEPEGGWGKKAACYVKLGGLRRVAQKQAANATDRFCPDLGSPKSWWPGQSSLSPAPSLLGLQPL